MIPSSILFRSRSLLVLTLFALLCMEGAVQDLHGQITGRPAITRRVVAGGGVTSTSSSHGIRGTLSQTAVGRLTHDRSDRHDVGFWYWAHRPQVVARVSLPMLEAEVGTRLTIPLSLEVDDTPRPFLPRPFRARIRFNHTLLHPAGTTPPCSYDVDDCVIEINGIAQEEGIIAEMDFIVALGNSESTPLTIEEFTWQQITEERIATVRQHGELKLLGVCRVGDEIRLITTGAFASRIRVSPNPASTHTTLEFVSAEAGPAEIRLVDLFGREILLLAEQEIDAEQLYRVEVELEGIASGSYMVVFATSSQVLTERLLITQ